MQYINWNSMEYFAILTSDWKLIKKGITEIEFIEKEEFFITLFTGEGLKEEATYYNIGHDNFKMAVIDKCGKYILKPEYNSIKYVDDEDLFNADGSIYNFEGSFIRKENFSCL